MVKCCVKSCSSLSNKDNKTNGITFHKIPKDPERALEWTKRIRLLRHETDWLPSTHSTICSKHFTEDDKILPINNKGRLKLSKQATPMVIDETDSNVEEQVDLNVETDEEMLDILETPRKRKMKKIIAHMKKLSSKRLKCIKKLRQKNRRLQKRNKKLTEIVKELKNLRYITEEEEMQLNINEELSDLMESFKNTFKKKRSFKKFPVALRKFALSVNFYSPAAYKYVRASLNNCLPHPRTLLNWYNKINGDPGFTTEAFNALKIKSDSCKSKILCTLVLDEMAIRQQKIFDGKKHLGYVDYGLEENNECQSLASSALVLLLVCLNQAWKLPIGYFFTHGLTGAKLSTLINLALEKCDQNNVDVVTVTCDGSQTNIAAMRILGCKLEDPTALDPSFKHPSTGKDILLMLDPCHMVKLVRNSLEAKQIFVDKNGREVNWKYIKSLQEIQDVEGLRLGNKLTSRHINFRQQIMKVRFATQVLSNSVAQSLLVCKDLLPKFANCEPTVKFIKMHNDVFDVLNSKGNPKEFGFKKALNPKNKEEIFNLIEEYSDYINNLKIKITTKTTKKQKGALPIIKLRTEIKPVLQCKFKTGFLGLLVCLESLKKLYCDLIETNLLKYIATYRLSQDHIEIFFGCIRQKGGYNNNPNVVQFKSAYNKMLNHLELTTAFRGNCIPLEKINILNCSPEDSLQTINMTTIGRRTEDVDYNKEEKITEDANQESAWLHHQNIDFNNITKYIVGYIAGYVVSRIGKDLECNFCIEALLASELLWFHKMIVIKDNGGLCYPTQHVFDICLACEKVIRLAIAMSGGQSLDPKYGPVYLATRTLEKIQAGFRVTNFANHSEQQTSSTQVDHSLLLLNAVINKYIKVRLYHESKVFTLSYNKETKRQLYNKLTLHSGV